jgi:A/G-specific adenine glycosylase
VSAGRARRAAEPRVRRGALLAWYDAARRDLPWRRERDPYRIWLSEVMLQQTRVETVLGYYGRWLERFPTLESLAEAPLDHVLKAWEGLGYYGRARRLHAGARRVLDHHGGVLPADAPSLRALPGIGRYTAGAIASIAFGRPEPVVDGNVRRVLARWADEPQPVEETLWAAAAELVDGTRPGDLNQALMELGATLCTPRAPRCGECPVAAGCRAREAGTQHERPAPARRSALPHEDTAVPLIVRGGSPLLVRRPRGGRLGGLWSFPTVILRRGEDARSGAERGAREQLGLRVRAVGSLGEVRHAFTHVRATYRPVRCEAAGAPAPRPDGYDEAAWVPWERLGELALPVAQRRIAELALLGGGRCGSHAGSPGAG